MDTAVLNPEIILKDFVNKLRQEIEEEKINNSTVEKWGKPIWTNLIIESFGKLGNEFGFKVYSSSHEGEYLLDLIWESKDGETGGLLLGLESEWEGTEAVSYDFYKLIYTKCELKVLIYGSTSDEKSKEFIDKFKEDLSWFNKHLQGEQYLFIDITDYPPYKMIAYKFTIPNNFIIDKDGIDFCKLGEFDWDEVNKNYVKIS